MVVPSFIVVLLRGSGHVNAGQSVVMLMQGWRIDEPCLNRDDRRTLLFATAFSVLSAIALGGGPALVALPEPDRQTDNAPDGA